MKMKIPTSGSGNGYYGHENGFILYLDNGIEIEPDIQNSGETTDFSEYLWMENEEEFDKQVVSLDFQSNLLK